MRPSDLSRLHAAVRVDSYALTAFLLPGFLVYSVVLFEMLRREPLDFALVIYALFGLVFPYIGYVSSYVYEIQPNQIVTRQLFGLRPPQYRSNSTIRGFTQKPNYTGRTSVFEIAFSTGRPITLHLFQRNFHDAVSALRAFNPDVPTQDLNKWGK